MDDVMGMEYAIPHIHIVKQALTSCFTNALFMQHCSKFPGNSF